MGSIRDWETHCWGTELGVRDEFGQMKHTKGRGGLSWEPSGNTLEV